MSLNLGLIADTSIQLSNLRSIVTRANFPVVSALLVRVDNLDALPEVDMWVVRLDAGDERAKSLIERLDGLDVPVIYDEADSYSSLNIEERARRFSKKIAAAELLPHANASHLQRARGVWVLAASAGGPEAVVSFIKSVPADLAGVAFVYVQHMDENMAPPLVKSLQRNTPWQVVYCSAPSVVYEKSIYVISPSYQVEFNDVGAVSPSKDKWPGPYRPSVDQMVAKIWRRYGKNSGVIVFSGMGDDGARTCRMIKNAGGQVWVQSPESCAVDSMPQEVLNTHCVSFTGTPEQLARQLAVYQKPLIQPTADKEASYE